MTPELPAEISQYIKRALEEDIGPGDVTTNTIVPPDAALRGRIVAKQDGVVAGLEIARQVEGKAQPQQLAQADSAERVAFVAATAEAVPMRERCVDLVTVSAAVHWFDRPLFYDEVRRVTRPGGVLAVWSYYHSQIEPAIDQVLERFEQVVASHWPTRFDLNRNLYRDLDLPFERLPWPVLHAEAHMRLPDLMNYLRTWSASQGYERSEGRDPVASVRAELEGAWGDPEKERVVRWPLHGAVGRIG